MRQLLRRWRRGVRDAMFAFEFAHQEQGRLLAQNGSSWEGSLVALRFDFAVAVEASKTERIRA